jgi:hypothetical protein
VPTILNTEARIDRVSMRASAFLDYGNPDPGRQFDRIPGLIR